MISETVYVLAESEEQVKVKRLKTYNSPKEASENNKKSTNKRIYQKHTLIMEYGIDDP